MEFILDLISIPVAYAQLPLPGKITPVASGTALQTFLCTILLSWVFTAAIAFSIIMALVAAFRYMTSAGDPAKVSLASNTLIYVAVGIAVAILARTLPILVGSVLAGQAQLDPCSAPTTTAPPTTPGT